MNNLTNEERARIFGMYINCSVLDLYDNKCGILTGVNYSPDLGYVKHKTTHERNYDELRLLLTPLSEITDEHAIEVAKIWDEEQSWQLKEAVFPNMIEINGYTKQLIIDFENSSFQFTECTNDGTWYGSYCDQIINIIDRLRELGYALPYKGKSLFELGVALDKTTLK